MKGFNVNSLQTYLTIIATIGPVLLVSLGCSQSATGALDCSQAMVSPKALLWAVAAIGFIKIGVLPLLQPGGLVRNLFSEKVPVSTSAAPGTVLPSDVMPPRP